MINYINKKREEKGFTLVELMVVVLIIAILLAVAVPVFLNARDRAIVRAAQQRLGSAVKAAKTLHSGGNSTGVTESQSGMDYADTAAFATAVTNEAGAITVVDTGRTGEQVEITANASADAITFTVDDANGDVRNAAIAADGSVTYTP